MFREFENITVDLRIRSDAEAFGLSVAILEEQFEEKVICHVDITQMEYGLGRVMIENTTDRYYYIPVLMLRGNVEYRGENTGTVLKN